MHLFPPAFGVCLLLVSLLLQGLYVACVKTDPKFVILLKQHTEAMKKAVFLERGSIFFLRLTGGAGEGWRKYKSFHFRVTLSGS